MIESTCIFLASDNGGYTVGLIKRMAKYHWLIIREIPRVLENRPHDLRWRCQDRGISVIVRP